MKLIERTTYLHKLLQAMGTPDIKVITGVRRSGKSKLLEALRDYIAETIPEANVIHINFNLSRFERYKDFRVLNEFIEQSHKKGHKNFVLIDEVQMCPNFELTINNLHALEQFDIYITGSNAFC